MHIYFSRNVKKVLILEVKIAANELGKDQLLGHYKICNASTNKIQVPLLGTKFCCSSGTNWLLQSKVVRTIIS